MKKSIHLIAFVLIFQLVLGSLPSYQAYSLQHNTSVDIINPVFLTEVSSFSGLIPVIVELKKEPTLDYVNAVKSRILLDNEKKYYRETIVSYQNSWLKRIQKDGISFQKIGSCTDSINMVSILIKGSDLSKIASNQFVKHIYDDRFLVKPHRSIMAQSTGVDRVWKGTETVKASGKNIVVGVIDTGIEADHPEFKGKILGGQNYIDQGTYKTDAYFHGTHVAGIIGGSGNIEDTSKGKGMAPDVKFYIYKALAQLGGSTDGIMRAMEQALADKCQIINMSLGRVSGEESKNGNPYYSVVKRIVDANVIVVASVGNSGARGKSVPWPAGSPGIVADSFCVAASNDRNMRISYSIKERTLSALHDPAIGFDYKRINVQDIVDCQYGSKTDFLGTSAKDKIALIKRGPLHHPISFADKMTEAKKQGAKAVIFVDYQNSTKQLLPVIQMDVPLPYLCVSYEDGSFLSHESKTDLTGSLLQIDGLTMAEFSSMGPTPDGAFKPEITAPGKQIMSPVPKKYGSYYPSDGTSMACPSISGQVALIKEAHPEWKVDQIKSSLMNTAYILKNPVLKKPVTFMLQGAGQARVDKAIQCPAFIFPRAFVIESAASSKQTFTVTNATKLEIKLKISVEYFIDAGEESPVSIIFDKQDLTISVNKNSTFTADVQIDKEKFIRPRIEGVIWVGDLHIPFIILRESSVTDNGKALRNPISDIFSSTQQIDYNSATQNLRVNFSFNTGSEQKFDNEISYSNYGNIKVYVTDPQGLTWDSRPIKEFRQCVIGDYTFEWDGLTTNKDYLPNGEFSLKFECSASDDNEIISKPFYVVNSPEEAVPNLILSSLRYIVADATFGLDLYIPTINDLKELDYTLYFDAKKLRIEKAEKADAVISWDSPSYKTDSVILSMNQFKTTDSSLKRIKLATIYFSAKGIGSLKFSNKVYVTVASSKKTRTLGHLPEILITKKLFLIGDINEDKVVDLSDYFLLAKSLDSVFGDPLYKPEYDINQDRLINQLDLDFVLEDLGKKL